MVVVMCPSLAREFVVEASECDAECLHGREWPLQIHRERVFADATELQQNRLGIIQMDQLEVFHCKKKREGRKVNSRQSEK